MSGVAAIVNDKVISTLDVEQRMKLMILSSGRQISPQMLPQVQNQALRDLVQERLKIAEGDKFDVEVDEKDVEKEIQSIAADGGTTLDGLARQLTADGISIDSLKQQIKASIVWQRLVQGRYRSRIRVSPEEIDRQLQRMREDATKEQFLVSEICIPVDDPANAQQIYQGSLQLIEQMRRGVPFMVVAQQFSACPSAATGGDLGWVRSGELPTEINDAIVKLKPGSVTNPIPSEGAFMIMGIRDKRPAVVVGEQTYSLAYASAPLSMGRTEAIVALEKLKTAEACGARALRQDLGKNIGVSRLENMKMKDIDPRFHEAIADLKRGDLSAPVEADDALHMLYVCEKDEGLGLPSRDALEDRAYVRELSRIGQQYLRDIERKASVDIRLKPEPFPDGAQQAPGG
jgi:peptidyl-prolyl cis-trans isomerase SurA